MPPHVHDVEPFAGGLAVRLAKPAGASERVIDVHLDLTTFWQMLQDGDAFARFHRPMPAVPFSRVEWEGAGEVLADDVARAAASFVRCRQSLAGRRDAFAVSVRSRDVSSSRAG